MTRIALVGGFGSGKTTIANAWCDIVNGQRLSFAENLRWEVARALSLGDYNSMQAKENYYQEMVDKTTKDKYRTILQWWGTEFRRAQNPNYWLDKVKAQLDALGEQSIAIDDCRFDNEYVFLKSEGFQFIHLLDGPTVRPQTTEQEAHASENDWKKWDVDSTLEFEMGPEIQAWKLIRLGYKPSTLSADTTGS